MNKRVLVSIIVIVLLAAGGGYVLWQDAAKTSSDEETKQQSDEQNDEKRREDGTSQVTKEEDGEVEKPGVENPPEENQTEQNQTQADHSITITSWGQNNRSKEVYVNAKASDASDGTCTLVLNKGGSSVSAKAPLQKAPTGYYACALRVGRSKFPSPGTWIARVTLNSGGAASRSQKVEINVQ